jgi:CelD/BcsL family acetyltransferase involved in cellulose biosynthesis
MIVSMSARRAEASTVPRAECSNSDQDPIEVETCDAVSSIPLLAEEWDALVDRVRGGPFLRPEWIDAWWRAFGAGRLELLTARRAGRLVGIAPLYRRHGVIRSLSNWHTPAFGFLSEDAETESVLVKTSVARTRRRTTLSFLEREGSTFSSCLAHGESARFRVLTRTLLRSPYLELEGDWASYERSLKTTFRRDLARRLRRLHEQGRVSFEIFDGRDRLDELLTEGFGVEASSWKGRDGTAVVTHSRTRQFYWAIARWAASQGWLRLAFLRLDGYPLAFHCGLEEGGVYYPLKGGYDPRFSKFSPGSLMVQFTLEHAFATGLRRYEFLGGDEPYKLVWSGSCRSIVLLHLFAPSAVGLCDWIALAYGRPLAKAARLTPIVLRFRH